MSLNWFNHLLFNTRLSLLQIFLNTKKNSLKMLVKSMFGYACLTSPPPTLGQMNVDIMMFVNDM